VWRRRGSEEGEAGWRVQEVQTQTPRSGFTDPRRKVRGEPNAGVRSQIPRPDFVVHRGPEERLGLQRRRPPRDDQDQSRFLVFGKRARRFRQNVSFCSGLDYRSVGDLACKRPVKPITVIFNRSFSIIYLLCSRQPRDVFFYLNFSFLLGK
jgi:hypothetical protein